jgi:tripartite-type tricarboxylate transporter receptor subunit TctC
VPTIAEAGVPGYQVYEWNAIFAPERFIREQTTLWASVVRAGNVKVE